MAFLLVLIHLNLLTLIFHSTREDFLCGPRLSLGEMNMMTKEVVSKETGNPVELKKMQILTAGDVRIVPTADVTLRNR